MAPAQPAAGTSARADLEAAMAEAARIVEAEKQLPAAVRDVQRRNLLRWLEPARG